MTLWQLSVALLLLQQLTVVPATQSRSYVFQIAIFSCDASTDILVYKTSLTGENTILQGLTELQKEREDFTFVLNPNNPNELMQVNGVDATKQSCKWRVEVQEDSGSFVQPAGGIESFAFRNDKLFIIICDQS